MADAKKTTKKPVKQAKPVTPKVTSLTELQAELVAKRQDLLDARRSHVAKELVNHRVITTTRKEIARIMTAINVATKEAK